MTVESVTAFAPASVGNVAVGFDLMGHVLEGPGDQVTVRLSGPPGVSIAGITGVVEGLPLDPRTNTAGRAVEALLAVLGARVGVEIEIRKGIPLGSGLGGSAASAVAAVLAASELLETGFGPEELYSFALTGEEVASGSAHGDNVGAQLLGGLVLATPHRLVRIPVPPGLTAAAVHPHFVIETRQARRALDAPYMLGEFVHQSANLSLVLAGCFRQDLELIRAGLADVLVEPRRASLIPGFHQAKQAALDHGALGASISGAGPTVFGWFERERLARAAGEAMREAFAGAGLDSDVIISPVAADGARVVEKAPDEVREGEY